MRSISRYRAAVLTITLTSAAALSGCMKSAEKVVVVAPPEKRVVLEDPVPGTVTGSWVEPMNDVVKVPARLDPTGTYYLPAHEEVVEIRPERFKEVDYGNEGAGK